LKSRKYIPIRYQLKKEGALAVKRGHPWIFRDQLSSATSQFKSGQWLRLIDAENQILGYGIYDTDGIIGIRVIKPGKKRGHD
jgi:23S rRNA G2069 N7-methylase RlmK/C1962 C5-methylase RlmI